MTTNYAENLTELQSLLHSTSGQIRTLKSKMDTPELQRVYEQARASDAGSQLESNISSDLAKNGYLGADGKVNTRGYLGMIGMPQDVADGFSQAVENEPRNLTAEELQAEQRTFAQTVVANRGQTSVSLNEYIAMSGKATSDNITTADYAVYAELSYASKQYDSQGYLNATQRTNVSVKEYAQGLLDEMPASNPYNPTENQAAYDAWNRQYGTKAYQEEREFLRTVANSERYADVTVDGSELMNAGNNRTNLLVVGYGDGKAVMTIQGSDGTVADWGQNTHLGVRDSETWSTRKCEEYAQNYTSIDLNGHSQGGHEAITVAVLGDDSFKGKIGQVVSLDGNGHTKAFAEEYASEIAKLDGKIIHYNPGNSIVGELEHGINAGNTVYVETNGTGLFDQGNIHPATSWRYELNGGAQTTERSAGSIIFSDVMNFVADNCSESQVKQLGETLFGRFLYDQDNPDQLGAPKNLDEFLVRLGGMNDEDVLNLASVGCTVLGNFLTSDTVADAIDTMADVVIPIIADTVGDIVSGITEKAIMAALVDFPVLNVILAKIGGKVLGKLASILTEKVLGEFVEQIKQGVKKLGEFLQQLGDAIDKYRQQITAAKTAARQAYIAANPKISSDCLQLEETAKLMQKAIDSLNEANDALKRMMDCFLEDVAEKITKMVGDDLVTKYVTKTVIRLASAATNFVREKWGFRLEDLGKRGAMENIRKACLRISAETRDVMRGTATSLMESSFTVEPAAMLAKCKVMETTAEQLKTQKNTFQTQMDNTKGYWQGSDQEAFERDVAKLVEAADIQIQNILVRVAQVSDAMQRYQQFQDAAVQICQDNT